MRGLDSEPDTNTIEEELTKRYDIKNAKCYRMKNTYRPLYLIVIGHEYTVKQLNNNAKYIAHTRVQWERHINTKRIIQCHRCQLWSHATANCRATPKCLKCGDDHWTRECQKTPDTPAKCANCEGPHPANNTSCPV